MSDETPTPEVEGAKPARKAPKGAVLVGVLVGGLAVGVAGGLLAIGPMVARSSGYVVTADSTHAEGGEGGEGAAAGGGEHGGKEGGTVGASSLHLIDNLVLNPAGSGGTRFLMVAAAIEFGDAALVEAFKARDAEVRDIVLRVMGAKTVEQLSDMAVRDSLRRELGDSLSGLLPKAQRKLAIRRVYFPQFVIQ